MRPHRLDISRFAKPGPNRITVKVTNLWINAMLGRTAPDYTELRRQFGKRFQEPPGWKQAKPLPSGLLGPVRILVTSKP